MEIHAIARGYIERRYGVKFSLSHGVKCAEFRDN